MPPPPLRHGALAAALLLAALAPPPARAAGEYLVQDLGQRIVPELVDGNVLDYSVAAGGAAYFLRSDGIHGRELWRSDGTTAGTYLVKDICPGACGVEHLAGWQNLAAIGARVYFPADDGIHGNELWVTDGTAAGTRMLLDLQPGPESSNPAALFAVGGRLWYGADDGVHGREPWRSDGTASGTHLVADLVPGQGSSDINGVEPGPGFVYLRNYSSLWRSDGTVAGTAQLCNGCVGGPNGSFYRAAAFRALPNGRLLFAGGSCWSAGECELWTSDGTAAGTQLLVDLNPAEASNPQGFHAVGDEIWFSARELVPPFDWRYALYRSDGTVAGTQPIPLPEGVHASTYWGLATAAGGRLFFAGSDAATGSEPWATDGLTTVRLADLRPGPDSSVGFGWDRPAFATVGDQALFIAELGSGPQLWRAQGTVGDVSPLTDFEAPPAGSGFGFFYGLAEPAVAQGRLLVSLWRSDRGVEIWSSDGTAAGTFVARTIANQTSSFGGGLDRVYWSRRRDACFDATDRGVAFLAFESRDVDFDVSGLRFSDGTPGGIRTLVKRFGVAGEQYACGTLGDRIFAVGGIEPQSFGLWRSDGTTAGTSLEYGFTPYPLGFDPAFARLGSDLLFVGPSSLYAIRGASPGPLLDPPEPIEELGPAPYVSFGELRPAGALVFVAGSGGLLVSDGHAPPLALLGEPPLPEGRETAYLAWDGATLFFTSWTQTEGNELWRTDGTPGGTAPVAVLRPGPASGVPPRQNWEYFDRDGHARVAALATGGAVFAGDDGAAGIELWVSDGSAAGTERIADLWPGPYPSAPHQLVALGGRVLFVAEHPAWGAELFATDGTAAGTALVRDLVPGRVSSQPQEFAVLDGVLYFSAWTPAHGREAWRSDGMPLGTWRLTDAAPGPWSSSPSRFAKVGDRLFFVANDNVHGFELWALDLPEAGRPAKAAVPRARGGRLAPAASGRR